MVADDSDYMKSPTDPTTIKAVQLSLSDIFDPTSNEFHVVRYRVAAHMTPSITRLTVRLMQGTDEIAAWTHDDLTSTPQTFVQNLAEAQAATITDYSDLRLEFSVVNI